MRGRIVVIGLDGATFDIIKPMIARGELRNFAEIIENGASGTLQSTILPLSATAWSSFASGKNPGKHGIYDFSARVPGTYDYAPTTAANRRTKAIWNLASQFGKKCCVANVPLTYPPQEIKNGIMVSGFPYPEKRRDFAAPREIIDELRNKLGITTLHKPSPHFLKSGDERKLIDEMLEVTQKQTEALLYLLKRDQWDLFISVFDGTDVVPHFFWQYIDPQNPKYDKRKAETFGPLFYDIYRSVDEAVGEIRKHLSPEDHLFVISDHGFGPVYYAVYMNNWLMKNNYLRLRRSIGTRGRRFLFEIGITTDFLFQAAKRLRLVGTKTFTYSKKSKALALAKKFSLSLDDIDWSQSSVYSYGNYGQFFINLKGREPRGMVSPGKEYDDLVNELKLKLTTFRDPRTGKVIFDRVFSRNEIYHGPFIDTAPDLVFLDSSMTYRAHRLFEFGSKKMIAPDPIYSASHRMEGILMGIGPDIHHLQIDANLIDLAPTIMHMLGLAVPNDMDGRVLVEIFSPGSIFASSDIRALSESSMVEQTIAKKIVNRSSKRI